MSPSLLYLKALRNINTFLHVIYKSKKKTNLLCIVNNVFRYSKIRTRKRNAKKSMKTEKNLESSPFSKPESTELESGIQYTESGIHRVQSRIQDCHGFPYMGRNQSVWVKNRVSFFRKLIGWLKILSRLGTVVLGFVLAGNLTCFVLACEQALLFGREKRV